ncbi:MAG: EF-hand domain-containing protein [Gemmataceae bacterium]|nr:EF-hand domain-containing protein [Gemmataceae bacterium]
MRYRLLIALFTLGVAGLLLGAVQPGLSQPGGKGNADMSTLSQWAEREFQRRDRDNDGYLSRADVPGNLRDEFERWDTNRDVRISVNEFVTYVRTRAQEQATRDREKWGARAAGKGEVFARWATEEFRDRDRNRDGFLTPREAPSELRDELARWDSNRDEQIDFEEFKLHLQARARQRLEKALQRWDALNTLRVVVQETENPPVMVYRAGQLPPLLPGWFEELDRNRDAQVSLLEWLRGSKSASEFRRLDRNDDGLLTAEELLHHLDQQKGPEDHILLLPREDDTPPMKKGGTKGKS